MSSKKARSSKKKKDTASGKKTFTGRLEVTRSGMGFVIVEGQDKDILIKKEKMGTALNGDEVMVEVHERGKKFGSRLEGTIVEVIKRKQTEFSGRLDVQPHFAFMIPDSSKMPVDIFIPLHLLHDAKNGDKVIVKIVEWSEKAKSPVGEVVSVLTNAGANEVAMQSILAENGFPLRVIL